MLSRLAFILLLAPASGAFAAVSTSHLPTDAAASALVESSGGAFRFATEVLLRDEDEDGKLEIRPRPVRAPGDRVVSKELEDWRNGAPVPFTLTFDGASRVTLTVTPRHRARSVTNLPVFAVSSDLNELFVRTEARLRGARVTASNLVLNGAAISDSSTAVDNGSGTVDILRIRGGSLAAGFTLTGSLTMSWSHRKHRGHEEERAKLDVQIWGAKVVAADTTPPVVTITAPASGSFVTTARPAIAASYADADSGINLASVRLMLDGVNRTAETQVSGSGLTFTPLNALAEGAHRAEVVLRDTADNEGRAVLDFTLDTLSPGLAFTAPEGIFVLGDASPTLAVAYSDATSGVDLPSLEIKLDGVLVSGCLVGATAANCEPPTLAAGSHSLTGSVRDRAGTSATISHDFELMLDLVAPSIEVGTPAEGAVVNTSQIQVAGLVTDDGQVVSMTINGVVAALSSGQFQASVPLVEGLNLVVVTALDATGKSKDAVRTVTLDLSAPRIVVATPAPGQLTNQEEVRVAGEVSDGEGAVALTIQGEAVQLAANRFEVTIPLAPGPNSVDLRAVDVAGNAATATLSIVRFDLPEVAITSPNDLSFLAATTVDVTGTVSDAGSAVSVNGVAALVSGTTFLARDVPLLEGGNILTATVAAGSGRMATDSINVVRDLTPPRLAIASPEAGATIFEPSVDVAGMVNDIVAGTVNASEAQVAVNGRAATIANRSFLVRGVPLAVGDNLLRVTAVDASGNLGELSLVVHRAEPGGPHLVVADGSHQDASIGALLPLPLVVAVLDASAQPVVGKPVLFKVRDNNGSLEGGKRRLVVLTDAAGRASVRFTLGTRAGAGAVAVEAMSPGIEGRVAFFASTRPGAATHLVVDSGDQQVGIAGRELPRPIVAVVTDAGHNRLAGAAIRLTIVKGQGHFANGLQEILDFSDSDGRVIVPFSLDPEEGIATNVVEARIEGLDPSPVAAFVASGRAAGDPAETSVSGVVLDNSNLPVAGVTLRILDTPITARTDERGLFRIQGAPVGSVKLIVDGSTVERPGSWPSLEFVLSTIPGRDNTVNMPIFLLPLDQRTGLTVDETHGGTLTLPEVPGFALEVAPGSVTFPGGSRSGVVSVTVVHNDKVPMVPNFGQQPRFIVTIQPAGARFEPPARLTLPNLEGLAPGEVTEMYSFDHDLGHFVSIGPATVSDDGSLIAANPGVGVIKAGWHCGGNPAVAGTPHACPPCLVCNGSSCVPGCRLRAQEATLELALEKATPACDCKKDTDPCSINKTCVNGKCVGQPVTATPIMSACVAAVSEPIIFTTESNAPEKVNWSAGPNASPERGRGPTFSTTFGDIGYHNVAVGCSTFLQTKKVLVARSCSTITVNLEQPEITQEPDDCTALGMVRPGRDWKILYSSCVEESKFCWHLSQFSVAHTFGTHPCGRTDLKDALDPLITPLNCGRVLLAFEPQNGDCQPPTYQGYYSKTIVEEHEREHVTDLSKRVEKPTFEEFRRFVNDPSRCTECSSDAPVAENNAALSEIWKRYKLVFDSAGDEGSECVAHLVSNRSNLAFILALRARARNAPAAERWPEECK